MVKFISINNFPGDFGYSFECKGKLFTTKYLGNTRVICVYPSGNHTAYDMYQKQNPALRVCGEHPTMPVLYSSGDVNKNNFYRQLWYFSSPTVINNAFTQGSTIIATSKSEPLALYYRYYLNNVSLSIHDFNKQAHYHIKSFATADSKETISTQMQQCTASFGAFGSSKMQDVFIKCNLFDYKNDILLFSNNYQIAISYMGSSCVQDEIVNVGEFNGDSLSDLICMTSKIILTNKNLAFTPSVTLPSLHGNWNQNFANPQFVQMGDFDGNGVTDFLSYASSALPQILFGDHLSDFSSGNDNPSGQFNINALTNWCFLNYNSATKDNILTADFDNNGKDDILCRYGNKAYLMLSQVPSISSLSSQAPESSNSKIISRVEVKLEDAKFVDLNNHYSLQQAALPLLCNSSSLVEHPTRLSCVFNTENSINYISLPINPSKHIRKLTINAHVKGIFDLHSRDISIQDPENELVNSAKGKKQKSEFLSGISAGLLGSNIGNQRQFESKHTVQYFRNDIAKVAKTQLSHQKYTHIVNGGECNEVNYNYLIINTGYKAKVTVKIFDISGKQISDRSALTKYYNLASSSNVTDSLNIGRDSISFVYTGTINLKTPYRKTIKQCTASSYSLDVLETQQNNLKPVVPIFTSPTCNINSGIEDAAATTSSSNDAQQLLSSNIGYQIIKREDILNMDGYIHLGAGFFLPASLNANNIYNDNIKPEDLYSSVLFDNNIRLVAFVEETNECPRHKLKIQYWQGNTQLQNTLSFPDPETGATVTKEIANPYAAFDNIGMIHLEAFARIASTVRTKEVVLAFSTYIEHEQQFNILLEYVNTESPLLKLPSYDRKFSLVSDRINAVNTVIIAYKKTNNILAVSRFTVDVSGYKEIKTINLNLVPDTETDFILKKHTSNAFSLVRSNKDSKGIFIQQYDFNLDKQGVEHNIICHPEEFVADSYNNVLTVAWKEKDTNSNQRSISIQYLEDGFLTKRMEVATTNENIKLNGLSFANPTDNENSFNIPATTEILYKLDNVQHLITFDDRLKLQKYSFFAYDSSQSNTIAFSKSYTHASQNNPFIDKQTHIKEFINNIDYSNQYSAKIVNSFNSLVSTNLKNELMFDTAIKADNSAKISTLINQAGNVVQQLSSGANANTLANSNSLALESVSSYSHGDNRPLLQNIGQMSSYNMLFDLGNAYNRLNIFTNQNYEQKNPQKLELEFKHDSVTLNANVAKKSALESALNFMHTGIAQTITEISKSNMQTINSVESVLCKNVFSKANLVPVLTSVNKALGTKTIYDFKDSTVTTKCRQDIDYNGLYRDKTTVTVCPTYHQFNYNTECKNILQLAQYINPESISLSFDNTFVRSISPFVDQLTDNILRVFSGEFLSTPQIEQVCNNINPYKADYVLTHNIARSLISGIMYKEPQLRLDAKLCNNLAINNCNTQNDRILNNLCLSDYLYIKSLLVHFTDTIGLDPNHLSNCATVNCDINSNAANSLLQNVGGYFNTSTTLKELSIVQPEKEAITFIPIEVNYTTIEGNETNATVIVAREVDNDNFDYPLYTNIRQLITSYSVDFAKNISFITSVYQGSGFMEVKGQFYNLTSSNPIGLDLQLGRFTNIKNVKAIGFDQQNIIIAYSLRKSVSDNYNIVLQHLTLQQINIVNVNPIVNGNFDIKSIPNNQDNTSSNSNKEFVLSYTNANQQIVHAKYRINDMSQISEISSNTENLAQNQVAYIDNVKSYISAFLDKSYNIIWGALETTGISLKTTNDNALEAVNSEQDIIKVAQNTKQNLTAIAWQHNNQIFAKLKSNSKAIDEFKALNYSVNGYALQKVNFVNQDIVALTVKHTNSTIQRLVFNASSNTLFNSTVLYEVARELVDPNTNEAFRKELERISNLTDRVILSPETALGKFEALLNSTQDKTSGEVEQYNHVNYYFGNKKDVKEIFNQSKISLAQDKESIAKEVLSHAYNYNLKDMLKNYNLTLEHVYIVEANYGEDEYYKSVDAVENFNLTTANLSDINSSIITSNELVYYTNTLI